MSMWAEGFIQHLLGLLHGALYSIQQEAVRTCLIASCGLIMDALRRRLNAPSAAAIDRQVLHVLGAIILFLMALSLSAPRDSGSDDQTAMVSATSPEPVGSELRRARVNPVQAVTKTLRFVGEHPLQFTTAAAVMILADYVNLLVFIDRVDPLLFPLRIISRRLGWVWRSMSRLLAGQRAKRMVHQPAKAAAAMYRVTSHVILNVLFSWQFSGRKDERRLPSTSSRAGRMRRLSCELLRTERSIGQGRDTNRNQAYDSNEDIGTATATGRPAYGVRLDVY
eukprot:6183382-Pleurochrysis_carterae.AAC.3